MIVKLVAADIDVLKTPSAVDPLIPSLVTRITSAADMFVLATVTVPATKVAVPIKSVAAPPFIVIFVATDVKLKSVEQFTDPLPACSVTAEVPVVLPIVTLC